MGRYFGVGGKRDFFKAPYQPPVTRLTLFIIQGMSKRLVSEIL